MVSEDGDTMYLASDTNTTTVDRYPRITEEEARELSESEYIVNHRSDIPDSAGPGRPDLRPPGSLHHPASPHGEVPLADRGPGTGQVYHGSDPGQGERLEHCQPVD